MKYMAFTLRMAILLLQITMKIILLAWKPLEGGGGVKFIVIFMLIHYSLPSYIYSSFFLFC